MSLVDFLGGKWLRSFLRGKVVGDIDIDILMGIEHPTSK